MRGSVLDLGCGTGMFAVELAKRGHPVTGVDPARPMLEIARQREGGREVDWIEADARELNLGVAFDTVLMIGHAFQTLLTATDRARVLETIARHLAPGGRFFFDSRNPDAREWESWAAAASCEIRPHPEHGKVERWNEARVEVPGLVAYETHYRLADGQHLTAHSRIAFPGFDGLSAAVAAAGLRVQHWHGDAAGGPVRPSCPDFIPVGMKA